MHFIIKNMVCPRCISAVKKIFLDENIYVINITLGKVTTSGQVAIEKLDKIKQELLIQGFELLDDKQAQIINQVKIIIINEVHHSNELSNVNFSTILSRDIGYDYSHLSRLFSSIEGKTIEKYIIQQKVEKIKEYITYDQLTISEIAFKLGYSSAAHLSAQFKKVTGMTPSAFKKLMTRNRKSLDEI